MLSKLQNCNKKLKLDELPSMIAHEVKRACELIDAEEYYGALIQIKDSYEVLIKTIVLIAIMDKKEYFEELDKIPNDLWLNYYHYIAYNSTEVYKHNDIDRFKKAFEKCFSMSYENKERARMSNLYAYEINEVIDYLNYREIINVLVDNNLSLGYWRDLLNKAKKLKYIDSNIIKVLEEVYSYTKPDSSSGFDLVNWRNTEIGHGALKFSNNIEFKNDLNNKLDILIELIEKVQMHLVNIKFKYKVVGSKNNYNDLSGPERALDLKEEHYKLKLKIYESLNLTEKMNIQKYYNYQNKDILRLAKTIDIEPLITISNRGIYLFDSFHSWKFCSYSIDYPNGVKNISTKRLNNWLNDKKNKYHSPVNNVYYNTHSNVIPPEVKEEMKKLGTCNDYYEPTYLKNKVIDYMENNSSGILLLSLDRGMGKTIFARALDTKNILDEDVYLTRVIYVNSYTNFLRTSFNDELQRVFQHGCTITEFNLEITNSGKGNIHRKNVSKYLNNIKGVYPNKKVVLVIDGLDEIPDRVSNTLLDSIPIKSDLDEGVYIILTARNNENSTINLIIKDIFIKITKIKEICNVDEVKYTIVSHEYQDFIREYLKSKKNKNKVEKSISDERMNELLKEPDRLRMVYLIIYKSYLKNNDNDIKNHNEIIKYHLKKLIKKTGNNARYNNIIHKLIGLLAFIEEPLTLYEIHYLVSVYTNEIELIGHLSDLSPFIRVDRNSDSNNRYSLSHNLWVEQVKKLYKENISNIRFELKKLIKSITVDNIEQILNRSKKDIKKDIKENIEKNLEIEKSIYKNLDYLLGLITLFSYSKKIYADKDELLKDTELEKKVFELVKFIKELKDHSKKYPILKNRKMTLLNYLEDIEKYKKDINNQDSVLSPYVLREIANYIRDNRPIDEYSKADTYYNRALELLEKDNKRISNEYYDIFNSKGLLYRKWRKNKEAIKIFKECGEHFANLKNDDYNLLYAKIISNIGIELRNITFCSKDMSLLDKSVNYFRKAIDIKKELNEIYIERDDGDTLAFSYHSLGLTYFYKAVLENLERDDIYKFEEYCKDTIKFKKYCSENGMKPECKMVFNQAIDLYKDSINQFKLVKSRGYSIYEDVMVYCKSHLATIYWVLNKNEEAKKEFIEAHEIFILNIQNQSINYCKMLCYNIVNLLQVLKELHLSDDLKRYYGELDDILKVYDNKIEKLKLRESYRDFIISYKGFVNVPGEVATAKE
ncbi:hypothetical protein [Abyssisolibacter fermentans]|uniref:hypothetical protein n=1 Tax=Abyssisolibacter fermentans TaxID=1766203 RepID=UPI000829CC7E|nr:hypothetical protein [Abyssisolibacter fermentans]